MITCKIPHIPYEQYKAIRRSLCETSPWGQFNFEYYDNTMLISFWDLKYVPECLKPFCLDIPGNNEKVVALNKQIEDILDGL
jgi:hypothetical protein